MQDTVTRKTRTIAADELDGLEWPWRQITFGEAMEYHLRSLRG